MPKLCEVGRRPLGYGKEDDTSSSKSDDDSSTLDLSETSPEKDEKEINLAVPEKVKLLKKTRIGQSL